MRFRPTVLRKGLDPESGVVLETQPDLNETVKAFHASVRMGFTPMEL